MIPTLAVLALALALLLLGRRLAPWFAAPGDGPLLRGVYSALAGALLFHLLVTLLDAAGVPWSRATLGLGLAVPFVLFALFVRPAEAADRALFPSDLGWGDGLALLALVLFILIAATAWIATPDFIFHWGLKGERFFFARRVDYAYLAQGWSWSIHPDYPNLLPELFAAAAVLAGSFSIGAAMLWSGLAFALILAAAREVLHRETSARFVRQAGIALLAAVLATFGIRHEMAGAADWLLALSLVAALPALLRPPDAAGDLQIGLAAAFAAAAKVEGVALAGLLALAQLARRPVDGPRLAPARLLRLGAATVAVVVPWYVQVRRYHLFGVLNADRLDWGRARVIFPAMRQVLAGPAWHGFAFALFLLPLLAVPRRTRPLAFVLCGQLLFYLWIYFVSAFDTRFFVISSFPRLLFQLVPALLVGLLVSPGADS